MFRENDQTRAGRIQLLAGGTVADTVRRAGMVQQLTATFDNDARFELRVVFMPSAAVLALGEANSAKNYFHGA